MRRLIINITILLTCLNTASVMAEIYKTVDKDGRVTYSDVPPPNTNAKPVELKSINTAPPPVAMPSDEHSPSGPRNTAPQAYQLKITAPVNGTTLLPNERSVVISTSLNTNLQNGDQFAYKLDGNILITTTETSYNFVEPPRGEHKITVEVIDQEGTSLAQSEAITLVVMRPLVKRPTTPVPKK